MAKTKTKKYNVEFVEERFAAYSKPVRATDRQTAAAIVARRIGADSARETGSTRFQAVTCCAGGGALLGAEFWVTTQ